MKKVLATIALVLGFATVSFAQNGLTDRMYMSMGYGFGGAPYTNFTTKDFAYRSFDFSVGYRFNEHLSLFIPITLDVNMMNMTTNKNFNETGTLGLGASYTIDLGKRSYLEPVLACGSTIYNSDLNYLAPRLRSDGEQRWEISVHLSELVSSICIPTETAQCPIWC